MPVLRSFSPILPVQSTARAIAFYRELGFAAERYNDTDDYAFLTRDGLELHLRRALDLEAGHSPSGIYFYLARGDAALLEAEFRAAGVLVLSPVQPRAWGMNEFMLSDPDGNLLRFGEPLNPAASSPS